MLIDILILIAGLVVLIAGGELLVRGASSIALRIHISRLVVGLTIVAFGTSSPELLISIKSALAGSPDLTMGNVIGSNICNLTLVLGITAVIYPIQVGQNSIKIDWPVAMGSTILLYFLMMDRLISHFEGVLFLALIIIYTVSIVLKSRKEVKEIQALSGALDLPSPSGKITRDIIFIIFGCVGLYFGAEWFVTGAQKMAINIGVSERVIGLTVVAIGTSLPELVTSVVASYRKQTDLALGNLMGSNIFNILSILGITSIIQEIQVSEEIFKVDALWMLGITLIILPMMLYKKDVTRWEGVTLLGIYLFYTYTVIS